jgi:hypothetical protein
VKSGSQRIFLTILACCLALQWLGGGMAAAHAASAGVADSHAESSLAPDKPACDAAHEHCSAAHPCAPAALAGARAALIVRALTGRLPEPRHLFVDYFPGRSPPPPLAVPA